MKISRRMEWPEPRNLTSIEELSGYSELLYKTLTEESALRAVELDVAFTDGYNVVLGHEAGTSLAISLDDTEGIYNVFLGHQAGYSNTTGIKNIAIGYAPLYTNTTGNENTALGSEALYSNTSGANNVALGNNALYTNATGNYNVAVGFEALKVSTASNNVAIGYQALVANTSGANNIGIGYQALDANSTGEKNIAIGESALTANTLGVQNIAIGTEALGGNIDGARSIAIGNVALHLSTSDDYNVAVGDNALSQCNGGENNVALGNETLEDLNTGDQNTALGASAGLNVTSGSGNVHVGYLAGGLETTGSNKLFIANSNTATPLIGGVFPNISLTFTSAASTFSGTLGVTGTLSAPTGSTIGNLTLANGSITDSSNAIDFGNEALSTSGTISASTAKLSNLTDGYVPYHVADATGLANSPIFIDGAKIGIGISPATKLHLYDTVNLYLKIETNDTGGDHAILFNDGTNSVYAGMLGSGIGAGKWGIYNTAARLVVQQDGNVGINDTTPTHKLDVNGTGRYTGILTLDSNLTLSSATSTITGGTQLSIEAGSGGIKSQTIYGDTSVLSADIIIIPSGANQYALYRSTSAQKYKDKIKDLELDSSLVYDLKPRSFNSLGEADDKKKRYHGLVADEIEQIYPEIIRYNKNNEAEGYDTQMLATLILSQLQEINKRIEALEAA